MLLVSKEDFENGTGLEDLDVVRVGTNEHFEQKVYRTTANKTMVSSDELRDLFTFEERVAIKSSNNNSVKTFYDDLAFRKRHIDLYSPKLRLALDLLLSEQLIAVGRDLEIIANEQQD